MEPRLANAPKRPMPTVTASPLDSPNVRGSLNNFDRVFERDRVHRLAGAQRGEFQLLVGVLVADLRVRAEAAQAHADRLAALGIGAEFARAGGFATIDAFRFLSTSS